MKHKFVPERSVAMRLLLLLVISIWTFSCEQEQPVPAKSSSDYDEHVAFLAETTGYSKDLIVFDEKNSRFIIDGDLVISKSAVEDYMAGKHLQSRDNGKTEQRRYTYLVSDAYVYNIKYFLEGSVPTEWRPAITQAINEWNSISGSKVRFSQVGSLAEANIRVNSMFEEANWVARAELPYSNGSPGRVLTINTKFNGMSAGEKLFTMVHEMGHNIGFLHTNQTDGSLIPGTPETDPNSVMNSFVLPWNGFTYYDQVALRQLYPSSGVSTVYLDCNFSGTAAALGVGDYTLGQLMSRGIGNDAISSLRVSSGYEVVLYQHDNFGGWAHTITSDDACLVDNGVNDQASSLRVRARSSFNLTIQSESYSAMAGVQTEGTSDAGGGLNVGWIDAGDWMAYSNITFPTSGTYRVEYRVASPNTGGQLSLDLNGGSIVLGTVGIPNTGGWQNWTTISHNVNINAGTYSVGVFAPAGGWNINWLRIIKI